ncbi:sn-glycerol-1-phosphate dehydrogenase [Paenibacillus mesophilus]|uniref:sn-glycerol-1-phosphate dehydrogenase n=1 Tax=Paenibacillus mesophilus TaxID=2582849 RepID=UPI00110D6A71|nr:sn-glycerol-1-phosphate dehydrogenase [Paenibacillus mesophilus]TMV48428.1 sn-glycerol-1-phosphate dehydrogenase [Paenibacillus mesophilus]
MMDITVETVLKRTPEQLAGISFHCACGQTHRVEMRKLMLAEGALYKVHELLRELNLGGKAMIVADSSSFAAAGKALADDLAGKGTDVRLSVFPEEQWYADEKALVRVLIDLEPDTELIIAVGSGTINDIARFVSYKAKLPYIVVATAPSMDGYASTGSPILVNGFKKTYSLASPAAIVGDLSVIRQAPRDRQAAGVGDMLAKITALCDWLLASVVEEEHYCEVIAALMSKALTGIVSHVQSIRDGEEQATKLLMEGLVLSGIAMQMIGNSRPASGAEHHISHYWEMLHFAAGHRTELHGIKVGAAVPIVLKLYDALLGADPDTFRMKEKTAAQIADWERDVRRCYGPLADEMIAMNRGLFLNQTELDIRRDRLVGHWPELKPKLQAILAIAPDVQALLRQVGAPAEPKEIGVSREQLADALRLAKEVRSRYTVLQLADQLGLLESFAEDMAAAH